MWLHGAVGLPVLAGFLFAAGCDPARKANGATVERRKTLVEQVPAKEEPEVEARAAEPAPLAAKPVILKGADFDRRTEEGVVLVDFRAPWCGWCRRLAPIIDKLAEEYAHRVVVAKLNTDQYSETATRFSVRGLPTLVVFKGGRQVGRIEGFRSAEQLRRALDTALAAE